MSKTISPGVPVEITQTKYVQKIEFEKLPPPDSTGFEMMEVAQMMVREGLMLREDLLMLYGDPKLVEEALWLKRVKEKARAMKDG